LGVSPMRSAAKRWAGRQTSRERGTRSLPGMALLVLASLLPGCGRTFFRNQADREVAEVLKEKDVSPAWTIQNFHVYPDPLARFADSTKPDRPPMPPDDPGAWLLAPNPQRPKAVALVQGTGYLELLAAWDRENRE